MSKDPGYVVPAPGPLAPLREAWRRREVFVSLALREVQVRYRQAWLGAGWALIQPLALAAVATLVFHRFLGVRAAGVPYPLFAFTGLFAWTFFHTAVSAAVPTFVSNASLLKKVGFPREALVTAAVGAAALDFVAGAAVWIVWLAWAGKHALAGALVLPFAFALLLAATLGPALLGAAANVYYRDVKHALPLLLQVVFFATPIVYPLQSLPPGWRRAMAFHPLSGAIESLRITAFEGRVPEPGVWLPGAGVALLLLFVAYAAFVRAGRHFADVV